MGTRKNLASLGLGLALLVVGSCSQIFNLFFLAPEAKAPGESSSTSTIDTYRFDSFDIMLGASWGYAANLSFYLSDPRVDFNAESNYSLSYYVYLSNANEMPSSYAYSIVNRGGGQFQYSSGTNTLLGPTGAPYNTNYSLTDRLIYMHYYTYFGNATTLGPYYLWIKASGGSSYSSRTEKTLSTSFTFPSGWNIGRTNTATAGVYRETLHCYNVPGPKGTARTVTFPISFNFPASATNFGFWSLSTGSGSGWGIGWRFRLLTNGAAYKTSSDGVDGAYPVRTNTSYSLELMATNNGNLTAFYSYAMLNDCYVELRGSNSGAIARFNIVTTTNLARAHAFSGDVFTNPSPITVR